MAQMLDLSVGVFEGCYGLASFSGPACQQEAEVLGFHCVWHPPNPPTQLPAHTLQSLILGVDTTFSQGSCRSKLLVGFSLLCLCLHVLFTTLLAFLGLRQHEAPALLELVLVLVLVSDFVGVDVGCGGVGDFGVRGVGV